MKAEAVVAAASAAGVSAVAGHILGVPVASLLAGFCGGLAAVLLKHPEGHRPSFGLYVALAASIVLSVICAGFAGPFTAAWLDNPGIDNGIELSFFSFVWGAGAQAGLLNSAISALQRRIDQLGGS